MNSVSSEEDDKFLLPDYFNEAALASNQEFEPAPIVILWDEVA